MNTYLVVLEIGLTGYVLSYKDGTINAMFTYDLYKTLYNSLKDKHVEDLLNFAKESCVKQYAIKSKASITLSKAKHCLSDGYSSIAVFEDDPNLMNLDLFIKERESEELCDYTHYKFSRPIMKDLLADMPLHLN